MSTETMPDAIMPVNQDKNNHEKRDIVAALEVTEDAISMNPVCVLDIMRLACETNMGVSDKFAETTKTLASRLADVDTSCLGVKLLRLLSVDDADTLAETLLRCREVVFSVIPELRDTDGCLQVTIWHRLPVYEHIIEVVRNVPADPALRLAALIHDIGKPACKTIDGDGRTTHFKGHPQVGADMALRICDRLLGSDFAMAHEVWLLVLNHDNYPVASEEFVRRMLSLMGSWRMFWKWFAIRRADILGQSEYGQGEELPKMEAIWRIAEEMERGTV